MSRPRDKMFHEKTDAGESAKIGEEQHSKPLLTAVGNRRKAAQRGHVTRKKMAKARAVISGQLGEMGR